MRKYFREKIKIKLFFNFVLNIRRVVKLIENIYDSREYMKS